MVLPAETGTFRPCLHLGLAKKKAPPHGGAALSWAGMGQFGLLRDNVGRIRALRAALGIKSHLLPLSQ